MAKANSLPFPFQIIIEIDQAEQEDAQLACKHAPEISLDPKDGDEEQNAGDTDSEAGRIDYKRQGSLANPVYDADQGIVSV